MIKLHTLKKRRKPLYLHEITGIYTNKIFDKAAQAEDKIEDIKNKYKKDDAIEYIADIGSVAEGEEVI